METAPIAKLLNLEHFGNDNDIKDELKDALEKHKEEVDEDDSDAVRLDAIRELDEKTDRKFAAMEKKIDELKTLLQEK